MSAVSRIFPEQNISAQHRRWPMASSYGLRDDALSAGVVFKGDAGYLRICTEEGSDNITVKAYPTKTMLKRIPPDVLFTLDITPKEFEDIGLDSKKATIKCVEMDDEQVDKIGHMMRIFSDSVGSPGNNYARRTSIMH